MHIQGANTGLDPTQCQRSESAYLAAGWPGGVAKVHTPERYHEPTNFELSAGDEAFVEDTEMRGRH